MLVERAHSLDALVKLVDEAVAGSGRLVFLGGEAGVGKTSLTSALVAAVADRVAVRRGGCDNVTTPAALGAVTEAVPEIAHLLDGAEHVPLLRLFHAIRDVLNDAPALVVFEDVHWADEATLDMLRIIGRRLDGLPVLVLATFRADEVAADHALAVVLGDVATLPGVVRMHLPPLTVAGVHEMAAAERSSLDAVALHRNTGGNPFYVSEVLASRDAVVPPTVRDAVLARTNRLPADARRVLDAAAVLGPRSPLRLVLDVAGEPPGAVDECTRRALLLDDHGMLAFRHELARLAVEQALSIGDRTRLHAAALAALRSVGERDDRRLAHHAAGSADHAAVLEHAPRAADRAARLGAHREAAQFYRLAIEHGRPDEANSAQLWLALSYECYLTDQSEEAYAAQAEVLRLAQAAGDRLAVGTAQRWLSRLSWFLGRNDESESWALRAVETLEALGESAALAMAYSNIAQLRMLATDTSGALHWGDRAVELAQRLGERDVEIHALNNVGAAMVLAGEEVAGNQRLARSLDFALAAGAHEHAARAYTNLGSSAVLIRRYADAERHLSAGLQYCTDNDLDSWRLYMSAWLARLHGEQGRFDGADELAADVLRHAHLSPITQIAAATVRAEVAMRRGRPAGEFLDNARRLAAVTHEAQRVAPVAAAGAEQAWLAGRPDEIIGEIEPAWPVVSAHPFAWEIGELAWWLSVAGERRTLPIAPAPPFALMLAGEWTAAAEEWHAIGSPLWAALALGRAARLEDARAALEIVDGLGATAVRAAILRDRHAAGLPIPRGPRSASRANDWGLTAREIEVLVLLADGLSNAELAARLFLSEKTIGHHVSSILRKLGEPSRSRAVAAALRRGVVAPK